jgi:hypothetical protein
MPLRVGQPERIHWKTFFRIAFPLAAVVGISPVIHPALSWLFLPAVVLISIHLYRRRQTGPVRPGQGAKMGAFIGLGSFSVYALIFAIKAAADPAAFRQEITAVIQEAIARNPSPEARQLAENLLSGNGGIVLFAAISMGFLLILLLVIGSVSGALASRLFREKAR